MIIENQIILKADEGMTLTNGKDFVEVVYIGPHDSADNWYEITDEEYMSLQEAGISYGEE